MSKITVKKLSPHHSHVKKIRKIHNERIRSVEEANTDIKFDPKFKLALEQHNLAYINFKGKINEQPRNLFYMAHSKINFPIKDAPIVEKLLQKYVGMPENEKLMKSYFVNKDNTLSIDKIWSLPNALQKHYLFASDIWKRNKDSESKLMEKISEIFDTENGLDRKVIGNLTLYTELYPCLSCSRKVLKMLERLSTIYPKINITIYYVLPYGHN